MVSYFTLEVPGVGTNFQKEISSMMHGFGDNPNPNAATVLLVENIVLQQLKLILQEAYEISATREAKKIENYDIIFLMRRNPLKLHRLYNYQIKIEERNAAIPTPGLVVEDDKKCAKRRTHIPIIEALDETDDVKSINFDHIDYLRKVRAAKISEALSYEKYKVYHKARCASFRINGSMANRYAKLDSWINPAKEFKIEPSGLEVLCFLAYETVGEIVDAVFLSRQDAKKRNGDPFSKFEGGHFCNPSSLSNAVYVKSGYEGVPAITVAEVREVLRRYFSPHGVNGMFYRNINLELPFRCIAF